MLTTVVAYCGEDTQIKDYCPKWQLRDWWVIAETTHGIGGMQSAPPDPGWFISGPFHWLCVVTETNNTTAILDIHQTARIDSHGRINLWPSDKDEFHPKPTYRITINLQTLSVTHTEELQTPYPTLKSLPLLLPSFAQGHKKQSDKRTVVEDHTLNSANNQTDNILFVSEDDKDLLSERKAWGLDWKKIDRPVRFEERQEWCKGDKWWRRMMRYTDRRKASDYIGEEEPKFGKEFWDEFRKTGWPEDKPNVEAKLIDQGNMNNRKPVFLMPPQ